LAEDAFEILKKRKIEREAAYNRMKGMAQGLRSMNLSKWDSDMLVLSEFVFENFKSMVDTIDLLVETLIKYNQRIKELEKTVKILTETVDTLNQNR
jgi:hypothetical protein